MFLTVVFVVVVNTGLEVLLILIIYYVTTRIIMNYAHKVYFKNTNLIISLYLLVLFY